MTKVRLLLPLIFFSLLILQYHCSQSQQNKDLIPYREGNKWGFSDIDRNIVIRPEYSRVTLFSKGIAFVRDNQDNWGAINAEGKVIAKLKARYIGFSKEGFIKEILVPPVVFGRIEVLYNLKG